MFYSGWKSYLTLQTAPAMPCRFRDSPQVSGPLPMKTQYQQYSLCTVNKPIKLTLASIDVIHSFYACFSIKRDAVPA